MALLYSLIKVKHEVRLLLVELSLTQQEEVDSLGSLPRVRQLLVGRGRNVRRNQRVHRFGSDVRCSLARARDLSDLRVKNSLLVGVDFEGS